MTESNLLQEIQEDMQRQKMEALWKRYGGYVLAIVLVIVLVTAAYNYMKHERIQAEQTASAGLIETLNAKDKDKSTKMSALQDFAGKNPGISQAAFAQLQAAGLAVDAGDTTKAVALYDALAKDDKTDPIFRQLADLLAVQTQMDKGDPAALQERLQPLLANSAWKYTAKEYSAHLAMKVGDKVKARQLFAELEQDVSAPNAIAQRAKVMAQLLSDGP